MEILLCILAALVCGFVIGRIRPRKALTPSSDGSLVILRTDSKKVFRFEFDIEPEELEQKEHVVFSVVRTIE